MEAWVSLDFFRLEYREEEKTDTLGHKKAVVVLISVVGLRRTYFIGRTSHGHIRTFGYTYRPQVNPGEFPKQHNQPRSETRRCTVAGIGRRERTVKATGRHARHKQTPFGECGVSAHIENGAICRALVAFFARYTGGRTPPLLQGPGKVNVAEVRFRGEGRTFSYLM